jgi:hypothetical protein
MFGVVFRLQQMFLVFPPCSMGRERTIIDEKIKWRCCYTVLLIDNPEVYNSKQKSSNHGLGDTHRSLFESGN